MNNMNQNYFPQGNYQQSQDKSMVLGIISLVCGILALVTSCIGLGTYMGVIGAVLGILGISMKSQKSGLAIAGLVCSLVGIVIGLIMWVIADSSTSTSANAKIEKGTPSVESNNSTENRSPDKLYVGDKLIHNDIVIEYASCKKLKKLSEYNQPKKGHKVIRLNFKVKNNSDSTTHINHTDFTCYADGEQCEPYYIDESISLELSPSRSGKGAVAFEIPKNAKEIEIEYEPNFLIDDRYIFVYE